MDEVKHIFQLPNYPLRFFFAALRVPFPNKLQSIYTTSDKILVAAGQKKQEWNKTSNRRFAPILMVNFSLFIEKITFMATQIVKHSILSYQTYTDTALLSLMKESDQRAFTELYTRHWEQMATYVLRVIRSDAEAQDIVQEVFISLWKRRETLDIPGPLAAYLLRSVRNLALRYIEKNITKNNFLKGFSRHLSGFDFSEVDPLEARELEAKIDHAVQSLPPKMREIFLLSRMENLSYRDIAERLGIADTTVKKQVSNALKSIRRDIGGFTATSLIYMLLYWKQ